MPFVPLTAAEAAAMLERVGVRSVDELFEVIPVEVRFPKLDLPDGQPELTVTRAVRGLAAMDRPASELACFLSSHSGQRCERRFHLARVEQRRSTTRTGIDLEPLDSVGASSSREIRGRVNPRDASLC